MSEASLQLLLHAGELEYIMKTIQASPSNHFAAGCLFGLWRNSLIQPVIQFVTGCRIASKKNGQPPSMKEVFEKEYKGSNANILEQDHRLLHLGFWIYGSEDFINRAYDIAFREGKPYNVLLIIRPSKEGNNVETWSGAYYLKKGRDEAFSELYKEDVLDGHSSFRLYKPLTQKIKDSVIPVNTGGNSVQLRFDHLPSRVQVEEAVTSEEQWYSSDEGMVHLQLLFQYFQRAGITPEMSRDTVTQDMQFGFSGGYSLDFPPNFPKKMPKLQTPSGQSYPITRNSNHDDFCAAVVETVVACLQNGQSSRRGGRGGKRW